jgi:hypothetical protein
MKKRYSTLVLVFFFLFQCPYVKAQVNLPYTLHFTSNGADNRWTDGIAEDGDGGTNDIIGLQIQIYTAGTDHTSLYTFSDNEQSVIEWYDNNYYYSGDASYTGITSGPSLIATSDGVPAMVIKSADQAVNFSLKSIQLYDWGYTQVITIETYDNGSKIGSVDFTPDPTYVPTTVSQSDLLTPALFNNIDEIRFFPKPGQTYDIFNLSFNNISLDVATGIMPVTFVGIDAVKKDKNIEVQWKVASEIDIQNYEVQRSADGKIFHGQVFRKSKGNSVDAVSYNWTDENPLAGNNFYRIKSVDKSGKEQYSAVVKVNFSSSLPSINVYPNPASGGIIHLQMNQFQKGTYYLKLINSEGQIVGQKLLKLSTGNSNETLNTSHLPSGTYLLSIIHSGKTIFTRKIQK